MKIHLEDRLVMIWQYEGMGKERKKAEAPLHLELKLEAVGCITHQVGLFRMKGIWHQRDRNDELRTRHTTQEVVTRHPRDAQPCLEMQVYEYNINIYVNI